jgi:hypothetical protein
MEQIYEWIALMGIAIIAWILADFHASELYASTNSRTEIRCRPHPVKPIENASMERGGGMILCSEYLTPRAFSKHA